VIDDDRLRLEAALKRTYDAFATWHSDFEIISPGERLKFRGSGIPHCPKHWAAESQRKAPRPDKRGFMLDYMSAHGTLVHEMVQKWFGVVGVMYGKWKCVKCGKILPEREEAVLGPVHHCSEPCSYVEFEMKSPELSNFSGHCDGVLYLMKKYLPIEMKVRNPDVIEAIRRAKAAKPNNVLQCTSYRRVLPELLISIPKESWHDYVAVLYFDRKDIRNREFVLSEYAPDLFENEVKSMRRTKKIVELKLWNRLEGICSAKSDSPYCPYNSACFCKDPDAAWEAILPGITNPRRPEDIPERFRRGRT